MGTPLGVPSSIVIRDLMLALWFSRRRIFLIMIATMALAGYLAYQTEPKYQAKSTLIVLLGPEHAIRPAAGQTLMNSFNVDPEQVFRTEGDILDSDDLHRSVIQQIGLDKLYPDLLKPPGTVSRLVKQARAYVTDYFGLQKQPDGDDAAELMVQAGRKFEQNFSVVVDRKSNIIQLAFEHPEKALSAQVLRTLEASYFELRGKLFADEQISIVEANERRTRDQLTAADTKLADFKRVHNVANFADRQKILMTEQGSLEDQLAKADSAIAGLQARLVNLSQQLKSASGQPNAKGSANAATPLQGMVDAYRKRENEAQTTYRGSPAYDAARTEILRSEADIAKMRSTQAFAISQEYNKTDADLRTNQAARGVIMAQLTDISNQLASVNAEEAQLHELERTRGVLEDNYKSVSKIASDRKVIEDVDANRQSSVRVVEAPRIPDKPLPIRATILMIGAVAGLFLSVVASLLSGFFRGVYLRPEALEIDTGLSVLAVVPDQKLLANPVVLVTPR